MGRKASSYALKASFFCSLLLFISLGVANAQERKKYIVYLGDKPHPSVDLAAKHNLLLSEALGSDEAAEESIIHSYTQSMNAFVAMMTEEEANLVAEKEDVISVFPSQKVKPQTTGTWDYIGMPLDVPRNPTLESDVIVGVIDSGIDPTHLSFSDEGFGPPPARWRGSCGPFENFKCNNKIIGAKWFFHGKGVPRFEILSPLDVRGHGTHIASTIAGSHVCNAAALSPATGTARGGVPSARLAIYKTVNFGDDEMLEGFDAAIHDGVDIISLSAGYSGSTALAIGTYHAMKAGILTSAAAGNTGSTVMNNFPWVMTVGAVSIDRQFYTDLQLGNGVSIPTIGVQVLGDGNTWYPLIYGADAAVAGQSLLNAERCNSSASLDPKLVKGSIVVCGWGQRHGARRSDRVVNRAGGAGVVLSWPAVPGDVWGGFVIPSLTILKDKTKQIKDYVASCKGSSVKAVARFGKPYTATLTPAPAVPYYSGRGPNPVFTEILKPDLVAPGESVLAAAPAHDIQGHTISNHGGLLVSYLELSPARNSRFAISSGTSMATPHATAAAAYVKSFHPSWSPAAIKSALMTTTRVMSANDTINRCLEYSYGTGLINPALAINPGLVYDADDVSYHKFLCTKYCNTSKIFTKAPFNCGPEDRAHGYDGLNYPNFQYVAANVTEPSEVVFHRSLTSVGSGPATYTAFVTEPNGVKVVVTPQTLSFAGPGQKNEFTVTLQVPTITGPPPLMLSGSLTWKDGVHSVRSPIVVYYPKPKQ